MSFVETLNSPEPWTELARAQGPGGESLVLRRRGDAFEIRCDGWELMSNRAHHSEQALGRLGCADLPGGARVLIGGLGMGYTLRAALDTLPADARVTVAEIFGQVVAWNRGPLAALRTAAAGRSAGGAAPRRCGGAARGGGVRRRAARRGQRAGCGHAGAERGAVCARGPAAGCATRSPRAGGWRCGRLTARRDLRRGWTRAGWTGAVWRCRRGGWRGIRCIVCMWRHESQARAAPDRREDQVHRTLCGA